MSSTYKPTNAKTVTCKVSGAYAYLYTNTAGNLCAMGFTKKAIKPSFIYRFSTEERRQQYVANFLKNSADRATRMAAERAARKAAGHDLKVGDILVNSWGYEQTNVDFYEVVGATAAGVYIRPIRSESVGEDGYMQGRVVARRGDFKGEKFYKRASRDSVSMAHGYCGRWDGRPMHYSSYH